MKFSMPWKTPRPVAEIRPWIPPWLMGFPVTQAWALMSCTDEEKEEECQRRSLVGGIKVQQENTGDTFRPLEKTFSF